MPVPPNLYSFLDQPTDPRAVRPPLARPRAPVSAPVPPDLLDQQHDAETNAQFANTGDPYEDMRQRRVTDTINQGQHQAGASFLDVGPAKRIGVGRQDEQMLEALGPEYAAEAERLAGKSSATPNTMYAKIGDKEFYGTPGQRVSRDTLGTAINRIAAEKLTRAQQAAEDKQFGQQQTMARIPGQSAVDLAKQQGSDKIGAINAEGVIQAPTRAANIAKSNAEVASMTGKEGREQTTFNQTNTPEAKSRAAADQAIDVLIKSGMDKTPQGKQTIAALMALGSIGSQLPKEATASFAQAATAPNPEQDLNSVKEFTADPEVARLITEIQGTKQGWVDSPDRTAKQAASRKTLDSYIARYAAAKNIDPAQLRAQLDSQLIGSDKPAPFKFKMAEDIWNTVTSPFRTQ